MAAIINALFGTYPEPEQENTSTNQTVLQQSASGSECLHTSAAADDVHVKSVISSETQANASINTKLNIDALLAQLNTTHAQVDQYSQSRTAEINEQVQKSVAAILENIKRQQEELLIDANSRHLIIDSDYKLQLQKAVEVLDGIKAKALAALERDLQEKQQSILNDAKKQIDFLNDQANVAKLNVLLQAQEQDTQIITNLADQIAVIGQQETGNLLQSTTTTVITSETQATDTTVTTSTDNQLQVAVIGPKELVPVPSLPSAIEDNTTVSEPIPIASDLPSVPMNPLPVSASADVPSVPIDPLPVSASVSADVTSVGTVKTVILPSQDNTTV